MDPVRQIARAVLYEGYLLWPYRESALKNRHRWTIGGVHPEGYGSPWLMRTECLLEAGPSDALDVCVRFLHVVTRHPAGQEATEREVTVPGLVLDELLRGPVVTEIEVADGLLRGPGDEARAWEALSGRIETSAERLRPGLARIRVEVVNTTPWPGGSRDEAMLRTLVSAHTVLRAPGARFVSLMDPPEELRAYAAGCDNVGAWPVLVGEDTMLSSPIILYDNPKIAPESPGDLFDATEIDQLLTLSVLALSDEERREIRAGDPRAREILDRCEALTPEELMRLHGVMRKEEHA
ncbi:hypothetical protein FH608_030305 [Nonomuraea phyllanthi]|uniref:Hydrogenase maturation protease n=1 Tax=Nonomuraea phyllanthi TaxID=2219224 RepID=A0A5C4W1R4_9ACTN|nr:hypothetical protein [Nonomuraea phyllanthi]KAB8191545.1 hypothetical protein FH608_030305 [Nonomuraea phyllanthi]